MKTSPRPSASLFASPFNLRNPAAIALCLPVPWLLFTYRGGFLWWGGLLGTLGVCLAAWQLARVRPDAGPWQRWLGLPEKRLGAFFIRFIIGTFLFGSVFSLLIAFVCGRQGWVPLWSELLVSFKDRTFTLFQTLNEELVTGAFLLVVLRRLSPRLSPLCQSWGTAAVFSFMHFAFYHALRFPDGVGDPVALEPITLLTLFFVGVLRNNLILLQGDVSLSWALHFAWNSLWITSPIVVVANGLSPSETELFDRILGTPLLGGAAAAGALASSWRIGFPRKCEHRAFLIMTLLLHLGYSALFSETQLGASRPATLPPLPRDDDGSRLWNGPLLVSGLVSRKLGWGRPDFLSSEAWKLVEREFRSDETREAFQKLAALPERERTPLRKLVPWMARAFDDHYEIRRSEADGNALHALRPEFARWLRRVPAGLPPFRRKPISESLRKRILEGFFAARTPELPVLRNPGAALNANPRIEFFQSPLMAPNALPLVLPYRDGWSILSGPCDDACEPQQAAGLVVVGVQLLQTIPLGVWQTERKCEISAEMPLVDGLLMRMRFGIRNDGSYTPQMRKLRDAIATFPAPQQATAGMVVREALAAFACP